MPVPVSPPDDTGAQQADLERLADCLAARGYQTRLVAGTGHSTYLQVRNPQADVLTERIHAEGGFFVWSWGEPVARREQIAEATDRIGRVLRTRNP